MKKGITYPEFMVVLILIATPFLILAVMHQLDSYHRTIGDYQISVLSADIERRAIFHIIDKHAPLAFEKTLDILAKQNGFLEKKDSSLNSKEKPYELVFPDLMNALNKIFTEKINELNHKSSNHYLSLAEIHYELYVKEFQVKGIPLESVHTSLPTESFDILGDFSFRPSFSFYQENELKFYPQVFKKLTQIFDSCKGFPNPKVCSDGWLPDVNKDLKWESKTDKDNLRIIYYKIYFNEFDRNVSYSIYFPTKEELQSAPFQKPVLST